MEQYARHRFRSRSSGSIKLGTTLAFSLESSLESDEGFKRSSIASHSYFCSLKRKRDPSIITDEGMP